MLVPSASAERRGSAACCWCYFPRFGPPFRFQNGYRLKLARRGEKLAEIAGRHGRVAAHRSLVLFFSCLFPAAFSRQSLLHTLLFAWFQVERMTLHFFYDV